MLAARTTPEEADIEALSARIDRLGCPDHIPTQKRGYHVTPHAGQRTGGAVLPPEARVDEYVTRPEIGLAYDPFRAPDAGADSRLAEYFVVDRSVLRALWADEHSLVVAEAGAGKSAVRVWLSHDCRTRRDGRKILAVVFNAPSPDDVGGIPPDPSRFIAQLLKAATRSLLLEALYRPQLVAGLHQDERDRLASILKDDIGWPLEYVSGIIEGGDFAALIRLVDPTASGLFARPSAERVSAAWDQIRGADARAESLPEFARWTRLVSFALDVLGYEAIYLLVDGIDGHPSLAHRPDDAVALMAPLFADARLWSGLAVFIKAFLPPQIERCPDLLSSALLTANPRRATILWTRDGVITILRQRLLAASRGALGSFGPLASPELGQAEIEIADHLERAGLLMPRDAVRAAEQMLIEHVMRADAPIYLEPTDLHKALLRCLATRRPGALRPRQP